MAFCGSCGAQVPEAARFCLACGQALSAAAATLEQRPQPVPATPVQQPVPAQAGARGIQPVRPLAGQQVAPPFQPAPAQAGPPQYARQPVQQGQPTPPQPYQTQTYQPPVLPGAPGQADIRDAQENKTMAVLAYLLFFVPLLTGAHKTSPFVKFHTNQGTVLFLASLALSLVFGILSAILTAILTASVATWGAALTLSSVFGFIWMALAIVIAVFAILGIAGAAGGKMKPLPVIGRIRIIK